MYAALCFTHYTPHKWGASAVPVRETTIGPHQNKTATKTTTHPPPLSKRLPPGTTGRTCGSRSPPSMPPPPPHHVAVLLQSMISSSPNSGKHCSQKVAYHAVPHSHHRQDNKKYAFPLIAAALQSPGFAPHTPPSSPPRLQ